MPLAFSAGPLALLLLAQAPAPAEPLPQDECAAENSRVELAAEPGAKAPVVCLTPGLPLTFSFDSLLQPGSVRLGEPEWFEDTATGKQTLTLRPRKGLEAGKRSRVEVCFADGAAPACATFLLVTHPGLGVQGVEVVRQKRSVESYQRAEQEARAEAEQCREEVRQLRAEREVPEGLRGALASGLLVGTTGIFSKPLTKGVTRKEGNALTLHSASTWRAEGRRAVDVHLVNPGTQPWVAEGAVLRGAKGQVLKPLPLWQPEPIAPGSKRPGRVVVEVLATEKQARGTYTLTLWDAERQRTVVLGEVTFP
ncbi:DUF2381 family protein [Archangium sp.]|uniref:DUF2381 family protein n=1 Tax=Archangium sp. TaxID=1872627 RepID=UPI00286D5FB9|nr:DUF2381 family protein [Archangium sp.]